MQVFVSMLTGEIETLEVSPSDTVDVAKLKRRAYAGIPCTEQRWIFAGRQLGAGRTFLESNIQHGATLHSVLPLRGGTAAPDDEVPIKNSRGG